MDTIHDIGGKQGFGPIPIGDDEGFHHDWERRMWAMARGGINPPGLIIDWFRHGLERMVPTDYLTFAYFNKWCANYYMLLVDADVCTMGEALSGHMENPDKPAPAITVDDVLAANRAACISYSTTIDTKPRFAVGDTVTTKQRIHRNHTRLPTYARNATGTVITLHGAHLLADDGADGLHTGEHLYTVSFSAPELWGAGANPRDTVTLELWESYFV